MARYQELFFMSNIKPCLKQKQNSPVLFLINVEQRLLKLHVLSTHRIYTFLLVNGIKKLYIDELKSYLT